MPSRKKSDKKVTQLRMLIIGFAVLVGIAVLGYGTLYSTGFSAGEYLAGEHYRVIENPPRRRAGAPIVVREYFSYGCIHCRNFEPLLDEWRATMPQGTAFERSPVAFSPAWQLLAQTYFALQRLDVLEENHMRLFRAIHDNGRQFPTPDAMADFVDGNGTTRADFLRMFNSPEVRRDLREADAIQRNIVISSVPTLVVADEYVVNMDVGRKQALDVVDYLLAQQLEASASTP
jgi:thiol:disulfide interchange protein DsbA